MPDVLTLKQLADHLQLSERTIYRLLGRGELPGFKVGGHWRFRWAVVDYPQRRPGAGQRTHSSPLGSRSETIRRLIEAVTFPEPVDTQLFHKSSRTAP